MNNFDQKLQQQARLAVKNVPPEVSESSPCTSTHYTSKANALGDNSS